uniref:Uncharacterized protein n=1 Tax=Rhizophora mucronata TaxID=61149 RepID=A0A2P2IZV4_RHIMU
MSDKGFLFHPTTISWFTRLVHQCPLKKQCTMRSKNPILVCFSRTSTGPSTFNYFWQGRLILLDQNSSSV